jgi:ferritin-like metal-binding protein YciE
MQKLKDLYVEQLEDAWSAENQIMEALPKMIDASSDGELRQAFETHMTQTEAQMDRLERIFNALGESPGGKKCKAMEGLLKEGEEVLKQKGSEDVRDAALIGAAQKVEHYEMALYGTLRTYAEKLGRSDDADLLQQTLQEEERADRLLTEIATGHVNEDARR